MPRYRKRPVEIEAVKFKREDSAYVYAIRNWMAGYEWSEPNYNLNSTEKLEIETLEGTMRARAGDYIIKGVCGEFYPCRGDIFEQTYEEVLDED